MLKPGEYEILRIRIEQYTHMIDYALSKVIENGATLIITKVVEDVMTDIPITTVKEKAQRILEVKARSTLVMGIPNEHQLNFNSIKDAKKLLKAVEKRFKMLDQTFDRLQKLVSQLELLEEKLSQKDVNQKLLISLSPKWNTHVVVWRNKAELDTMSMDDLYKNLKVYEPEVKGMSSSSLSTQNMAFVLTMRARRFLKKTGRKRTVNGNETIGFDKSNVKCYNCHKRGNFTKECRALRNLENKNNESSRRSVLIETSTFIAFVSCDGLGGYDWSDQADCSKSCLETVKLIKSQNYQLLKDLKKSELMILGYKMGLESVEERLEFYKTNESIYLEDIKVLKVEIQIGEIAIRELRKKLEIAQKQEDVIQLNVDKFEHASKSLNKLIECQIVDNCKKGLGYENYSAVPPFYTGNFMPPTPDLSFTGLDEFVNKPIVENCKAKSSEEEPKVVRKNDEALSIEE
nr:hypothetical protein [Tanacetum cinerariifolium]